MTAMNWEFDSDSGVYKNHHISNKLLHASVADCKVAQFARPAPGMDGLFKRKGETFNIMHLNELPDPTSTLLEEDNTVPIDKTTFGNRPVTMQEHGRGVEYSNLAQQFGKFDLRNELQSALKRQMTRALDTDSAVAFQSTDVKICFIPTSLTGGTFDVDGTPSTLATANITFDHMGVLADYLAGDIHCPPFEGDDFIMLSARKTLRGLKQDSLWQEVHMYLQKGDLFFKGEAGKAENIRAVQVDREAAFSNTAGSSAVLGEAVVFGNEAVCYVETSPPQLYADPNFQSSFGRTKAMCWQGLYVFFALWNVADDTKSKIIRVTSS
jgi:N4-gp56 family major capsid protein